MATFLLTWNQKKWPWDDLADDIAALRRDGELGSRWSCAASRRPRPGDRFFLLRQGLEPRGIVGAGWIASEPYEDRHWRRDAGSRPARYVDVVYTELRDATTEPIIPRASLDEGLLGGVNWNTQSSGISIRDDAAGVLEELWQELFR